MTDLLQQAGIITFYLPPDLMPLKESFSCVNNLRRHDKLLQALVDPIQETFESSLTRENCLAWIHHAGYNIQLTRHALVESETFPSKLSTISSIEVAETLPPLTLNPSVRY